MPISEKRLAANRANAVKSRGPITPEGKRNSSRNATRHGMLANSVVIDGESRPRFLALLEAVNADLDPQTSIERAFVEKYAASQWNSMRLWAVQSAGINHEMRRQSDSMVDEDPPTRTMLAMRALMDSGRSTDLFSRYEQRLDRQQYRALEALERLQQRRIARAKRSHQPEENKEPVQ